jgi:hypothetical protein
MGAGAASAQTTVLTPTSSNYDLVANSGVDKFVEISSGTNAYFTLDASTIPAGSVGILGNGGWPNGIGSTGSWDLSWWEVTTNAPVMVVDSGATLTFDGSNDYNFESMIQATGDVTFLGKEWRLWKNNSFLGNITIQDGATIDFGSREWGCCTFAGTVTFGSHTNIDMNGGKVNFYQSGAAAVVGGRISGSAAADLEVASGKLVVNGNYGTTGRSFAGTVNIASGASFTVGDSTHASAVFGDPAARINLTGASATLSGYGTINGTVNSSGIIKAGGTNGVNGGLTINGNLTQASSGQIYTAITPTGISNLTINGTAAIGGDLFITVADGTYSNRRYHLVTATSFSGSFNHVYTVGNPSGPIIGILKTPDGKGYDVLAEGSSATQVYGHLAYANRSALTNFVGSLYDAMATTSASGAKIDVWLTPIGEIENLGRDGLGYEQKTYGVSMGGMHRFESHNGVVGAAFSYRHGNLSVKNDPATASSNGYDLALYGGADVNALRVEASAFYSIADASTKRPMGSDGTSFANQTGYAYGISGQISHDMFQSLVTPYVRATYARHHWGAATEAGSGDYDLRHDAINANTLAVDLGIRAHLLRQGPDQRFKMDVDLSARHDLSNPGETVMVGFANIPGATGISYWRGDSKNSLRLGLNAAGRITDQIEAYTRVGGTLTSHRRAGELAIGVKYKL